MAYNGVLNARRHGAHDSALDVESKDESTRMRIRALEEENGYLADKANAASQRFADYENHILMLQTQLRSQQQAARAQTPVTPDTDHGQQLTPEKPVLSRFGSFMRKPSPVPPAHSAREQELEASLAREQAARKEAEKKVKEVNAEIEELSASLFQQANDMVAAERKESAALKAKVKELEKTTGQASDANEKLKRKLQSMEQREIERDRRLDKLEAAQKRIDRVRLLLPR